MYFRYPAAQALRWGVFLRELRYVRAHAQGFRGGSLVLMPWDRNRERVGDGETEWEMEREGEMERER